MSSRGVTTRGRLSARGERLGVSSREGGGPCNDTQAPEDHTHVDWWDVSPPHRPHDRGLVDRLVHTLRREGHLPPVLLWDGYSITGSHRHAAFSERNRPVCAITIPEHAKRALIDAGFAPDSLEFPDVYELLADAGFTAWRDSWTEERSLV